ncbi:hypothetical protein AgCh_006901 [Apium graveolens]
MASAQSHLPLNVYGGSCNADPVGITACGVLMSGNFSPLPVRSCCKALSSVSTREAEVCLGNAVENEAAKIGNIDASAVVHTTLTAGTDDKQLTTPKNHMPNMYDLRHVIGMAPAPSPSNLNLNCSSCNVDPVGIAACGVLVSGNFAPTPIRLCCKALSNISTEEAEACLCHAVEIEEVKIGNVNVSAVVHTALTVCSKLI